jgi:hypothetical protein
MKTKLLILSIVIFIASLYSAFYLKTIGEHWLASASVILCALLVVCSFTVIVSIAVIYLNDKI